MILVKALNQEYRESIYIELLELSKGKIYLVMSSLDDKIYVKKIIEKEKKYIYEKIKDLSIPNTPKIYELIVLDEKLIVIEEYINGYTLKEILKEYGTISQKKVIEYSLDLIRIMEKFHSYNPPIIHKDVNPSNIMISNDGVLKLIDFDISRIHSKEKKKDTHILGTQGYAAPEQFGFNQTDLRTDIYSLGVTMNVMLVGKLPNEELYKGDLEKIISKCIELDPNKRFQSLDQLKNQLLKLQSKIMKGVGGGLLANLPGFKSDKGVFKIFASAWYILLILIALGFFYEESLSDERIIDIGMALFFFGLTLLYGNFNNLRAKLPMLRSKNILSRILGYIVYTLVLIIAWGMAIPN